MFNTMTKAAIHVARASLPERFTVIECGTQTSNDKVTTEEYYKMLGCKRYETIDIHEGTYEWDLNYPLPAYPKFDLVTNNGTSEHLFDQARVFENIHRLCRKNGLMLHILPFTRWMNHGFYNYNPIIFNDLGRACGYKLLFYLIGDTRGKAVKVTDFQALFAEKDPEILDDLWKEINGQQRDIFHAVCFRHRGKPFRKPIQRKYDT